MNDIIIPYLTSFLRNECFCGHTLHTSLNKLPDRSCNMKCTGDLNQTCGGYYTMAIYETGIESKTC